MLLDQSRMYLGITDVARLTVVHGQETSYVPLSGDCTIYADLYTVSGWDDDPYKDLTPCYASSNGETTSLSGDDGVPSIIFKKDIKVYYLGEAIGPADVEIAIVAIA